MVPLQIRVECTSYLGDILQLFIKFLGSLVVGLRLLSCTFVMLLPLGARAHPQTHSKLYNLLHSFPSSGEAEVCGKPYLNILGEVIPLKCFKNYVSSAR